MYLRILKRGPAAKGRERHEPLYAKTCVDVCNYLKRIIKLTTEQFVKYRRNKQIQAEYIDMDTDIYVYVCVCMGWWMVSAFGRPCNRACIPFTETGTRKAWKKNMRFFIFSNVNKLMVCFDMLPVFITRFHGKVEVWMGSQWLDVCNRGGSSSKSGTFFVNCSIVGLIFYRIH